MPLKLTVSLINYIMFYHSVKFLLRPSSSHSAVGLGDTKETSFCNVTEDIVIADPRKGLCPLPFFAPLIGGKLLLHCQ